MHFLGYSHEIVLHMHLHVLMNECVYTRILVPHAHASPTMPLSTQNAEVGTPPLYQHTLLLLSVSIRTHRTRGAVGRHFTLRVYAAMCKS